MIIRDTFLLIADLPVYMINMAPNLDPEQKQHILVEGRNFFHGFNAELRDISPA